MFRFKETRFVVYKVEMAVHVFREEQNAEYYFGYTDKNNKLMQRWIKSICWYIQDV